MVLLSLVVPLFAACAVAAPAADIVPRTGSVEGALLQNGEGRHGGFFYSFWADQNAPKSNGVGPILYRNLEGGRYKVQWGAGTGNFVAGKGWNSTDADKVK